MAPLTSTMITQLNNSNAAMQRAQAGTLLGRLDPAGYVFYVDGNFGLDTNDGLSWGTPFKTLTVALAASATAIASGAFGWAARNTIYCKADTFTEDLVLLAPKTDVIGVGSYDQWAQCGLIGNHVPTGTTASYGTRFYNFYMRAPAAGGDIWTLDSTCSSFGLFGCVIDSQSSVAATAGIVTAASPYLHLGNNEFRGKFSDSTIEIGTGDARGLRIVDNYIESAGDGIELLSGTTDSAGATEQYMEISGNKIISATIGINDASSLAYIEGNRVFTANAKGLNGAGAIVGSLARGQANRITASDANNAEWPALGAL